MQDSMKLKMVSASLRTLNALFRMLAIASYAALDFLGLELEFFDTSF